MAPANDVVRQLVGDRIPDTEMRVYTVGLRGCMVWQSFYTAAERTCRESDSTSVKSVPWVDPAAIRARLSGSNGPNIGVNAPPLSPAAPEQSAPRNAAFDVVALSE